VLFNERYGEFVALATTIVRDRTTAEEVVQDAFAALIGRGRPIDDQTKLGGYLAQAVVNGARSRLRRRAIEDRPRVLNPALSPALATSDSNRSAELLATVLQLPKRQAQCVVCRYVLDMTFPEIASTLGISQPTAKTHVRRGTAQLATWMKEHP
jgi:RNA polymerase sigma factor (sigma-70 family)